MKRYALLLAFAAALSLSQPTDACTNFIVGKKASADGSVICTYNCDGFGFAAALSYSAPGRHEPGEMVAIRGWGPGSSVHYIPQAEYTYKVVGLMNEKQVSIVETTWGGREELRDPDGWLGYFNLDDATMVAYVPVYCGINRIPDPFRRENNNVREFSFESAFWMCNWVANMVYPRWSAMIGDLREAQKELEDYYEAEQDRVDARAAELTAGELSDYLTATTIAYTDRMMKRWDKLAKLLIVKHNDQIMLPSENGELVRGRHTSPAYAPAFIDAVKSQTGERYVRP